MCGSTFALANNMVQKKTSERGFEFSCRLIDEFRARKPTDDAERHIWWQLLDAGFSVGANASESGAAESDDDFIHKFQVSLKEGRETLYWLKLLAYASPDRSERVKRLYDDCDQIVAILVTSIKTKKANRAARKAERRDENSQRKTDRATASTKKPKPFLFEVPD